MKSLIHKKYKLDLQLQDFSQKAFEQYQMRVLQATSRAYVSYEGTNLGVTATAIVRGETIRAAIQHGILTGMNADEVDNLAPAAVVFIADKIAKHVKEITTHEPDPNS